MSVIKSKGSLFAATALVVAVVSLLASCGGGGGGSAGGSSFAGKLVDGYVQNATVTLDVNDDRICESNEPKTTTDAQGNFSFTAAQNPNGGQHMTCASGGIDLTTGLPLVGQLLAPPGATQITPLTNLVMAQVNSTLPTPASGVASPAPATSVTNASTAIAGNLGLTGTDVLTVDPVAAAQNNSASGVSLLATTAAVQVMLQQTAATVTAAASVPTSQTNNVYQNAATALASALSVSAGTYANSTAALTSTANAVVSNAVSATAVSLAAAAISDPTLNAAATAASALSPTSVATVAASGISQLAANTAGQTSTAAIGTSSTAAQTNVAIANTAAAVSSLLTTANASPTIATGLASVGTAITTAVSGDNASTATSTTVAGAANTAITTASGSFSALPAVSSTLENVVAISYVNFNGQDPGPIVSGVPTTSTQAGYGIQNFALQLAPATSYSFPTSVDLAYSFVETRASTAHPRQLILVFKNLIVNSASGTFSLSSAPTTLYAYGVDSTGATVSVSVTGTVASSGSTAMITSNSSSNISLNLGPVLTALNSSFFNSLINTSIGDPTVPFGSYAVTAAISNIPLAVCPNGNDCTSGNNLVAAANTTIATPSASVSGSSQSVSLTLTPQIAQAITFGTAPASMYIGPNGTGTVSATGGNSGNAVTFTSLTTSVCTISGSTVTGVTAGQCTIAANQPGSTMYSAATQATQSFNIGAAPQTITFGNAPTVVVGGTGTVSATASSGLTPVTFTSLTTSVCSVSGTNGSTVTGVTVGTCTIQAAQAGSSNFSSAMAQQTISIGKGTQAALTVTGPSSTMTYGSTATLGSSGGSGSGTVTFTASGGCSVSGTTLSITSGTGTCAVTASKPADSNYNAATSAPLTVTLSKASQSLGTVTFSTTSIAATGGTATVTATPGNSSSPVTFAVTSADNGICTISDNVVTGAGAGTCTITASQAADANYNAATQKTGTISVGKAGQSIGTVSFSGTLAVGGTTTVSATATSALAVAFTSSSACTVGSTTLTSGISTATVTGVTAGGTCTITANQAGNSSYSAATAQTGTITVAAVAPGAPTGVTATAGDTTATVTFTAPTSTGGATITGYTVTPYVATTAGTPVTGTSSPITVTGLTDGTAYTFTVTATNTAGTSGPSSQSNSVTPKQVPTINLSATTTITPFGKAGVGTNDVAPPNNTGVVYTGASLTFGPYTVTGLTGSATVTTATPSSLNGYESIQINGATAVTSGTVVNGNTLTLVVNLAGYSTNIENTTGGPMTYGASLYPKIKVGSSVIITFGSSSAGGDGVTLCGNPSNPPPTGDTDCTGP